MSLDGNGPGFLRRLFWTAYLAWHARGQGRYAFRPLAAIRRDQARRVRRIVAYAYRHVPHYRETLERLGVRPSDVRTAEDLAKLPVLEREHLQRDPERFLSAAVPPGRRIALHTGGSVGAPIRVESDARHLFLAAAFGERHRSIVARLLGKRRGYRETTIYLPSATMHTASRLVREHCLVPEGVPSRTQHLSVLDPPETNVARMNEFRPDALYTYGSYLEMLFAHVRATGAAWHLPKVIAYGGDCLASSVRRLILEEYRIPLLSAYQANEAPRIAFECEEHRGLHVNVDICPVRIVDAAGRPLLPGEPGDVVVSNLLNRAMVLLNYRLGDVAALLPDPCPCGRSLPLLSVPLGRCDDFFLLPSGQVMNPVLADELLGQCDAVWQYQIVQEAPTRFTVRVVAAPGAEREALRQQILAQFAGKLGGAVAVQVAFVDAIERTAAGKRRSMVSRLPRFQRPASDYTPDTP